MLVTEKTGDSVVVRPEGKITAANVETFRQDLLEIVNSGAVNILIDLEKVDMIDSKGLAIFIVCHKTLSEKNGELTVMTGNEDLRGLFHVMRLDKHFKVVAPGE